MPFRIAAVVTCLVCAIGGVLAGCAQVKEEPAAQVVVPAEPERAAPQRSDELWLLPRLKAIGEAGGSEPEVFYASSGNVMEIVQFYRAQMKRRGWKEEKLQAGKKSFATLWFLRKGERLSVSASAEPGAVPPRVQVALVPLGTARVSELPRYPGAKALFSDASTAIYVTPDPVEQVFTRTLEQLRAAGWHEQPQAVKVDAAQETVPGGEGAESRNVRLSKGRAALDLYVAKAPAQKNQTTLQYALRAGPQR